MMHYKQIGNVSSIGGIEAEAKMLGQPMSMILPGVAKTWCPQLIEIYLQVKAWEKCHWLIA
ncbi:Putative aconitate hydratase, cytoplasmic [Arachis hypogaea]|nr:Putative aconitate hydratase, cytoplasmic [Arachis hypogaea]